MGIAPGAGFPPLPTLSKTRFMAGVQCHKRVHLETYHRTLAAPADPADTMVREAGAQVGLLAHGLFPGGLRIGLSEEELAELGEDLRDEVQRQATSLALMQTRVALADPQVPAIFEAAIAHGGHLVRPDVLARVDTPDGAPLWDLLEVKQSSGVTDEHKTDVAFQALVLQEAGVPLRRIAVVHPNSDFVRGAGPIDPHQFFLAEDVTAEALERADEIRQARAAIAGVLARGATLDAAPDIPTGPHCKKPMPCPFLSHCHARQSPTALEKLPRMHPSTRRKLADMGVNDILELPDYPNLIDSWRDVPNKPKGWKGISDHQGRIAQVVKSGVPYFDAAGLARAFAGLQFPIYFLDFEFIGQPIPLYEDVRPGEQVPNQYSLHILERDGQLRHEQYLHMERTDPRVPLVQHLLPRLGTDGTVVVYSDAEGKVLRAVAQHRPEYGDQIAAVQQRFLDLLDVIEEFVYLPEFAYKFSIKKTLPAIVPGFSYEDLAIKNGAEAMAAYVEMMAPGTSPARRTEIAMQLFAYCGRDTEAMVRMLLRLMQMVAERVPGHQMPMVGATPLAPAAALPAATPAAAPTPAAPTAARPRSRSRR